MTNTVYKIVSAADWRDACRDGVYRGSVDDRRDGFIHLSTGDQLEGTAERHFLNRDDLLLVAFDAAALGAPLRFEPSRGGALFPHLYGELATGLARWEKPMTVGTDGVPRAAMENA